MVETILFEDSHHATVFHLPVLHNKVEEELAHLRRIFKITETMVLDNFRYREHGSRIEPSGNIVE